ncbi:MAG: mannose-1-phosphate guanylyltransferase [Candidatus Schekmanbacteria bacterium]|nr:mannose-1-phosphate guanylyltransferase [Candidatus Schekmanbacteria bacterium]
MSDAYAVIMAGGKGTRFWPLSTGDTPKQFLTLIGEESLLQTTVKRVEPLFDRKNILVITNRNHQAIARKQLPQLPAENIICEPEGKNTAPCIGLAAIHILSRSGDADCTIIPSDHIIREPHILRSTLKAMLGTMKRIDGLYTIGFKPLYPETGYGYIRAGAVIKKVRSYDVHKVKEFTEKPSVQKARKFIKSGNYFWNSGIFGWRASTIMMEFAEHCPDLFISLEKIKKSIGTVKYNEVISREYKKIENISIDYAILEKSQKTMVIPSAMNWTDIGSWDALENIYPKDKSRNVSRGKNHFINSENCIVFSSEGSIVLLGVKDLIVVKSENKVFVCGRGKSQDAKQAVEHLKKTGMKEIL